MSTGGAQRSPLVGMVVEGSTEYQALPEMLDRLGVRHTRPSCIHGQPTDAPVNVLVEKALLPHVRAQLLKGAHRVLVVLDGELRSGTRHEVEAQILGELRDQVARTEGPTAAGRIEIALSWRRFENWLLSDPDGIAQCKLIRRNPTARVRCHADEKEALRILKQILQKGVSYCKAVHGPRIARFVRVQDAHVPQCSASLRCFIALVTR